MSRLPTIFLLSVQARWLWLLMAVTGLFSPSEAQSDLRAQGDPRDLAANVILLANASDPASMAVAEHYAEARGVPRENIISLPMPAEETIRWPVLVDAIYQPLQDELVRRGWIDAMAMQLRDKVGRRKYVVSGHKISYLVVCRGVPLRVDHEGALYTEALPFTRKSEFRVNCGSVDAELALIAQSGYAINAFVPNPLFRSEHPAPLQQAQVVRVSRLDGPSQADALALVDNALAAEAHGLIGRAYVDIGGPHPEGDQWLENVVRGLAILGFDTAVNRGREVFSAGDRFDAPALYFGWYSNQLDGPFARSGFRFPPGAIALHIHSFSAVTMRSRDGGWVGPLVSRGVTGTVGNVYEPYLPLTHHPHLFLRALAQGRTLGDAAFFALPALSWQAVLIGDPLYRPFGRSFAQQWEHRHELSDALFPHVVARQSHLLERSGQAEQAAQVLRDGLRERPGLVLGLRMAEVLAAKGDAAGANAALDESLNAGPALDPATRPLLAEAARFFAAHGAAARAVELYERLLSSETLGLEQRLTFLAEAVDAARGAGASEVSSAWSRALDGLRSAVPPPEKK